MASSVIINVDVTVIINTANSFNNTGSNVRRLMQQMVQLVNSLSNVWTGEAASAYKRKFDGLSDDIEKLIRMIEEHVRDLNEMAKNYEKAETDNITEAGTLADDVII